MPSFLDRHALEHKEWYHFIFYDKASDLYGFLNFSLVGNAFSSSKSTCGAMVFFIDREGNWLGEFGLSGPDEVRVSNISPTFVAADVQVSFDGGRFILVGELRQSKVGFRLSFTPTARPVSTRGPGLGVFGAKLDGRDKLYPIQGMKAGIGEVAKGWVSVPRARVDGEVSLGARRIKIDDAVGYHDHNWGKFGWGDRFGWDGGVAIGDAGLDGTPIVVGFLFDRSPFAVRGKEGGLFVRSPSSFKSVFTGAEVTFRERRVYQGPFTRLPGTEVLLAPDYTPTCPAEVTITGTSATERLEVKYSPTSLCELTTSESDGSGRTVWLETFGKAKIRGTIDGRKIANETGFWMESVRSLK